MKGSGFDPIDFQPNSVGVLVVRVIRLKDIMRALDCTEARALEVVKEIRGETGADGTHAFVLPSQLARWTYRRAGEPVPPPASTAVLVPESRDALSQAAKSASPADVRADLKRLESTSVQPGAPALTVEQAAARLGCSRSRVYELLKERRLTRAPRVGRLTMVTLASVDALLEVPEEKVSVRKARGPRVATRMGLRAEVTALKAKFD